MKIDLQTFPIEAAFQTGPEGAHWSNAARGALMRVAHVEEARGGSWADVHRRFTGPIESLAELFPSNSDHVELATIVSVVLVRTRWRDLDVDLS